MYGAIKRTACLITIGALAVLGCSEGDAGKPAAGRGAAPAPPALRADVPQTPEAAVNAVLDALRASKPVAIWDAMDSSWKGNFNQMVREIGTTVDHEVWERSVRNLKKLVLLMETKKDFILENPLLRMGSLKVDDLKANWAPVLAVLKTISQSELVDQEKVKNFDGHAFLEGTGAKLYAQARALTKLMKKDPLKELDSLRPVVKESSAQSAKVTLQSPDPGGRTINLRLGIRDGQWTADEIGLVYMVANMQKAPFLERFRPYALAEWKDAYLKDMGRLEKALDGLLAAKTSSDFQTVVAQQILPFVLQKTAQLNRKQKPLTELETTSRSREKDTAMVVIQGSHFGDEPPMRALLKRFRALSQEGQGKLIGPTQVEGATVFLVSPVSDAKAFAKSIDAGKVTKVDAKTNTVSIELPPEPSLEKATAKADGAARTDAAK